MSCLCCIPDVILPSINEVFLSYLALLIHSTVGQQLCVTWHYVFIHRWAGDIVYLAIFVSGIMHPPISLNVYLIFFCFYLFVFTHPSISGLAQMFTWHNWFLPGIMHHPSVGWPKYLHDIICFYLALFIHPSVGWPNCLPDNICFYLALCFHPSVGWPKCFIWHHLFLPGIMHPSISGLAKIFTWQYLFLPGVMHPSISGLAKLWTTVWCAIKLVKK